MNQETPMAQGSVDVNVSRHCTCHPDDNPPTPCEHRYAFRDCADAAEERYLREALAMLQESYAKAAKPYIDRLVALHSMSVPQMIVTVEQAQALGLMPANVQSEGQTDGAAVGLSPRLRGYATTTKQRKGKAMEQSARLRQYNAWRRDNTGELPMPNPTEFGELLDGVADRLEVLERESVEHFDRWHEERRKREKLADAAERCHRMLLSEADIKGALFKAENILREAVIEAKATVHNVEVSGAARLLRAASARL